MTRVLALVLCLVLTACAQRAAAPGPGVDPELGVGPVVRTTEPSPIASVTDGGASSAVSPPADGAATPTSAEPTSPPSASRGATASPSGPVGDPSPATSPSAPASPAPASPGPPPPRAGPVVLLAVTDAAGDHGARGPDWADLRALELEEVGEDLRVTARFSGPLPAAPPEGEVPLMGIDIGDQGYQLFVEGGGGAWAAYLDTPDGFVEYPGTFELAGRAMVLQVPFNALGSPTRAPVRAFVEWSRDQGLVAPVNPTSEDTLDGEPHMFDRNP